MDYTNFLASSYEDPYSTTMQYPILNLQARLDQAILFEKIKNNSNPNFIEPSAFISFNEEEGDTFRVQDDPNQVLLSDCQLQIQSSPACNPLFTNSEDYTKDFFQTWQSQGPGFFQRKNLQEAQDFLNPTNGDFWGCNNQKSAIDYGTDMYKNIEQNTNDHMNIRSIEPMQMGSVVIPSFEAWNLPGACNMLKSNSSRSESTNACDNMFCHSPIQLKNQKRQSLTTQTRLKKKRKTENSTIKIENNDMSPPSLKLKKSKSEFDQNYFLMTPESGLLTTYTEMPCNHQATKTSYNQLSACCHPLYLDPSSCEKNEREEKSTDISYSTPTCTKLEDSPNFLKTAYSTPVQQLNQLQIQDVASCDLSERLTYPTGYNDSFYNTGILAKNIGNVKRIGPLTVEERQAKIEKYLQKRKQRSWSKKISYDCRKRVADGRLRIRGRFVTKSHAFAILEADGIAYDPNKITMSEIKEYLTKKFMEHPQSQENKKIEPFDDDCFNFETKKEEDEGELYYGMNDEFAMSPIRSDDGKCGFPYN